MTVTTSQVRSKSGATTELIDDAGIQNIIDLSISQAYNHFNFKKIPTDTIEFVRNYDINNIKLKKGKLMTIKEININGTDRNINTFTHDEDSGKIQPDRRYDRTWVTLFPRNKPIRTKVKYSYAMMKSTGDATESTADVILGDSVDIAVEDESDFAENDYVRIQGFDGFKEVAKVTATDTNEITLDKLYYSHEKGSVIEKLEIPEILNDYILLDCAYQVANYIVGNTSNLPTSWSQEGESATVGVAYTHWRDSRDSFKAERDNIEKDVWSLKVRLL